MEGLFVDTFVRRVYLLAKIKEDEKIVQQHAQIEKLKEMFSEHTCEGCTFPLLSENDQLYCDRCGIYACTTWKEHHPNFDYENYSNVFCCKFTICADCWDYCCYCAQDAVCIECAEETNGMCASCYEKSK